MQKLERFIFYFGMAGLGGAVILILLYSWWNFYPYKVEDYITFTQPVVILNKDHKVKQGDVILWQGDSKIIRPFNIETTITVQAVKPDAGCDYKTWGTIITNFTKEDVGSRNYTNKSYIAPLDFKPCKYHIKFNSKLCVNPYKCIPLVAYSEPFDVVSN